MGSEENDGGREFQQRNSSNILTGPCSNSVMCSESMFKAPSGVDPFYGSGWDPIASLSQNQDSSVNEFANPHYSVLLDNQAMGSSSHLVHFPSDSGLVDVHKIPCFGSGGFSEMATSFGHESGYNSDCVHRASSSLPQSMGHCQNSANENLKASPNGKRKRDASLEASPKNAEEEQQEREFPKGDERKQKLEPTTGINSRGKQSVKQAKDNRATVGASKENYIHVRAKRGQATNSHSLAERVRRERISERMRLLQELVPGCNKITGKAVMLDEIINYVQSLQQQVEFLSMKLATVNPELNVDIERILSKDILNLRGSSTTGMGIGPGLSLPHTFPGYSHRTFNDASGTNPFNNLVTQNLWSNPDLQSILQKSFDSNPSVRSLGPNGLSKMGL